MGVIITSFASGLASTAGVITAFAGASCVASKMDSKKKKKYRKNHKKGRH